MSIHERMESIADLHAAGGLGADERREADERAAACAACAAASWSPRGPPSRSWPPAWRRPAW